MNGREQDDPITDSIAATAVIPEVCQRLNQKKKPPISETVGFS